MTTEDVIIIGPRELKRELASILQENFSNVNCVTTEDINISTVQRIFKDHHNFHEDPIISYLEELIQKSKDENLIFGLDEIKL